MRTILLIVLNCYALLAVDSPIAYISFIQGKCTGKKIMSRGAPKPLSVNDSIYLNFELHTEFDSTVQIISIGTSDESLLIPENKSLITPTRYSGNLSSLKKHIQNRTITKVTLSGNGQKYLTVPRTKEALNEN